MKSIEQAPFFAAKGVKGSNNRVQIFDANGVTVCTGFTNFKAPERVAAQLAQAFNATYGKGMHPNAFEGLKDACERAMMYLNDSNKYPKEAEIHNALRLALEAVKIF